MRIKILSSCACPAAHRRPQAELMSDATGAAVPDAPLAPDIGERERFGYARSEIKPPGMPGIDRRATCSQGERTSSRADRLSRA